MKEDEAKRRMKHLGMGAGLGRFRNGCLSSKDTVCSLEVISCLPERGKKKQNRKPNLCSNITVIKYYRLSKKIFKVQKRKLEIEKSSIDSAPKDTDCC